MIAIVYTYQISNFHQPILHVTYNTILGLTQNFVMSHRSEASLRFFAQRESQFVTALNPRHFSQRGEPPFGFGSPLGGGAARVAALTALFVACLHDWTHCVQNDSFSLKCVSPTIAIL